MQYQKLLFDWVSGQSGLVGVVILAAGLLYGMYGVRMLRLILAMTAGGLGAGFSAGVSAHVGVPPALAMLVGGGLGAWAGLAWPRFSRVIIGGITGAFVGAYLLSECGIRGPAVAIAAGVVGLAGMVLTGLNPRTLVVVVTSVHGAGLVVIGLVGLASDLIPTVGYTFRQWTARPSLIPPVLITMLVVTFYSYQVHARLGGNIGAEAPDIPRSARRAAQPAARKDGG